LIILESKDKNKKSKTEVNLAQVISTQSDSTSQAGGSDSHLMIFSFSVTTTIGYSGESEWMLDTGATYHVCPNRDLFYNFEKLNGYSVVYG